MQAFEIYHDEEDNPDPPGYLKPGRKTGNKIIPALRELDGQPEPEQKRNDGRISFSGQHTTRLQSPFR